MNRKYFIYGVIFVAIISAFILNKNSKNESKDNVIKIGAILPLTGSKADLGNVARASAQIAIDEVNNQDTKYKYELIFEDDKKEPKRAALAYNKLANIDKIDAVMSWSSACGNVVAPIAQKDKIIHFGLGASKKMAEGEYNFVNMAMPEDFVGTFINEFNNRNIKNISVVYSDDLGPVTIADELEKQIKDANLNLVDISKFNIGERDYRQALLKILNKEPQLVIILMYSPEFEIFYRQLRELGYKKEVATVFYINFIQDKSGFKDIWYIDEPELNEGFKKELKKRADSENTLTAANVYEVMKMIAYGFENSNENKKPIEVITDLKKFKSINKEIWQDKDGIFHSETIVKVVK